MPTKHVIKTPILNNQYPIVKLKQVVNNNDVSSIKKLVVTPF